MDFQIIMSQKLIGSQPVGSVHDSYSISPHPKVDFVDPLTTLQTPYDEGYTGIMVGQFGLGFSGIFQEMMLKAVLNRCIGNPGTPFANWPAQLV